MTTTPHARHGTATDSPTGAILAPAGYAVLGKMRWRTPRYVVDDLALRMALPGAVFDLDAAAEDGAHVADRYLTVEEDALVCDWQRAFRGPALPPGGRIRSAFLNPPYAAASISKAALEAFPDEGLVAFPGTAAFIQRAWEQSRGGLEVAVLLGGMLDQWLQRYCARADEVLFGPRLHFLDLDGKPQSQPPIPHLALIFRPNVPENGWPGGPRTTYNWDPRPRSEP